MASRTDRCSLFNRNNGSSSIMRNDCFGQPQIGRLIPEATFPRTNSSFTVPRIQAWLTRQSKVSREASLSKRSNMRIAASIESSGRNRSSGALSPTRRTLAEKSISMITKSGLGGRQSNAMNLPNHSLTLDWQYIPLFIQRHNGPTSTRHRRAEVPHQNLTIIPAAPPE